MIHSRLAIGLAAFFGGCSILPALVTPTSNVSLSWNPSGSSGVAGYSIYYGTVSHVYTNMVSLGNVTSATISNLTVGTTYYFAVTVYNSQGMDSPYSNEVAYTVPLNQPFMQLSVTKGKVTIAGSARAGTNYTVMASQNLTVWSSIGSVTGSTNGTFQFTDPAGAGLRSRFYRLKSN